jgi:hypothetical protein
VPTTDVHRRQAEHNLGLALELDYNRYPDWAAVVMFYCAVHWVEAVLAELSPADQEHSATHRSREARMRAHPTVFTEPVYDAFRWLKTWSVHARYDDWQATGFFTPENLVTLREETLGLVTTELSRALR